MKGDGVIDDNIKADLKEAVAVLESIPDHQKDWHPGSNGQVLDLVHPSLFPLVYGRSRILPASTCNLSDCIQSIGLGEVVPRPDAKVDDDLWSPRFQWLPCDVSFSLDGEARIDSYINNLHPHDHGKLYTVLEKIITRAMPFWNTVYQCHENGPLESKPRIVCEQITFDYPDDGEESPPDGLSVEEEDTWYEDQEDRCVYAKPEPAPFTSLSFDSETVKNPFDFLGNTERKIQVIVKLANIHLTPDKPCYNGGSWHIEGQMNEHIVSTALYYYDNTNITDSHLSFRTKVDAETFSMDLGYEQNDFHGIEQIFGISNDDINVQEVGSVLTREDRVIAFPNGFQHRVGSFRLTDPAKPGHRKILAMFLVQPATRIISTANVPPQQREWWLREVKAGNSKISNLPEELVDMIGGGVEDFPIGIEEAREMREELMAERGKMDEVATGYMADWTFSFCEH